LPDAPSHTADPIARGSIVDTLARRIRQRILRNEIPPGAQLRQEALAESYGVSRIPVREALRQLEAEGLVAFNPNRSVTVSALSVAEAEELFDLRLLIETDLIGRGAEAASPVDHAAAREALARSQAAYSGGDASQWGEHNQAFHACLYAPAARPQSLVLVQALNAKTDRYVRLQLSLQADAPARAQSEHQRLLDLYIARDISGVRTMLQDHIGHVRTMLLEALRSDPEFSGEA
jgi:DNA-binding GntR family transcriptional regulator